MASAYGASVSRGYDLSLHSVGTLEVSSIYMTVHSGG